MIKQRKEKLKNNYNMSEFKVQIPLQKTLFEKKRFTVTKLVKQVKELAKHTAGHRV